MSPLAILVLKSLQGDFFLSSFDVQLMRKVIVVLKHINRSLGQTISILIFITAHSRFSVPVRAINIAKRRHLSLGRIEILLSALKSTY